MVVVVRSRSRRIAIVEGVKEGLPAFHAAFQPLGAGSANESVSTGENHRWSDARREFIKANDAVKGYHGCGGRRDSGSIFRRHDTSKVGINNY